MADIDRLEIEIETQAKGAVSEINKLERALQKLSDRLKGIDIPGAFDKLKTEKGTQSFARTDKAIQKADKSLESFMKSIADVGKNLNFEGDFDQLQDEIVKTEKALEKLWNSESKQTAIGANIDTKGWRSLQYDIQKTSNYLQNLYNQYEKLSEETLKPLQSLPISRWDVSDDTSHDTDDLPRKISVPSESMKYNHRAMNEIFGTDFGDIENWQQALSELGEQASAVFNGLSEDANKFSEEIKRSSLSTEEFERALENLEIPEIDETNLKKLQAELDKTEAKIRRLTAKQNNDVHLGADPDSQSFRNLSRQIVEASKYADALKEKIKEISETSPENDAFSEMKKDVSNLEKGFSQLKKSIASFGKQVQKVFSRFWKLMQKIGSGFGGLISKSGSLLKNITGIGKSQKSNNHFGIGRMLGTSLLFSSVFQAIGAIKSAIKEGSDNLVQYSSQYNASISSMVSALYTLKNAFAVAFAPIVNVVAPYITAFINMLNAALNKVGQFFAALTGKKFATRAVGVTKDYAAGLSNIGNSAGDSTDAVRDLDKAISVLGFDELNKLQDSSGSGGGPGNPGAGGGGIGDLSPLDMFEDVPIDDAVKKFADKLKEAWKKADFTDIGKIIGNKINYALDKIPWNKIKNTCKKIGKSLATFLNGTIETINWKTVGDAIAQGLNSAFESANAFVQNFHFDSLGKAIGDGINGVVNGIDWPLIYSTLQGYAKGIGNAINNAVATIDWHSFGNMIGNGISSVINAVKTFVKTIKFGKLGEALANGLNGVFEKIEFSDFAEILTTGFNGIFEALGEFTTTFHWNDLAKNIANGLDIMINDVDWETAGQNLNKFITDMLGTFEIVARNTDWEEFGRNIGVFLSQINWSEHLQTVVNIIQEVLGGLLEGMAETPAGKFAIAFGTAIAAINLTTSIMTLVNNIGKVITGDQSYSILKTAFHNLFGKSTADATTALEGVNGSMSTTKGWMQTLGESTFWTAGIFGMLDQAANRFKTNADMTDYMALSSALGRLKDNGLITEQQFDNLNNVLSTSQRNTVPFEEALADLQEELRKSGVKTDDFKLALINAFEQLGVKIPEEAKAIGNAVGDGLSGGIENSKDKATKSVVNAAVDLINAAKETLGVHSPSVVMYGIGQNVMQGLENGMTSKGGELERTADGIGSRIKKSFDTSLDTVGKNLNARYKTLFEQGQQAGRNIESAFTSIRPQIPYIMIDWSSINFANLNFSIPRFRLTWFAKGGFPNAGELFMANEKGPEMIGKMGHRNVVANNKQITDGIKNAVVEGMMEVAMATSTGGSDNKPYVLNVTVKTEDNEVLARAVEKGQMSRDMRFNPVPAY